LDLHLPEGDRGERALERQLAKLRTALGAPGWDRMVVVHGVGEGILRNAVHTFVRNETPYRIGKSTASETEVIRV
jgi:dsDNA-specific endonuclease/ATPase MutS2